MSGYQTVDKILLWRVPNTAKLEELGLKLIKGSAHLDFFFERLGNFFQESSWFAVVLQRKMIVWGFFKETELFIDVIFGNDFVWTVLVAS